MKYHLLLILFFPSFLIAQSSLEKHIEKFVRMETDFREIPGLVIGVIEEDSSHILKFGAIQKNGTLPNETTMFELGSLTKVFTATLIDVLVKEGTLDYDKNIGEYLDIEGLIEKKMLLRHLVSHSSGFPRLPFDFGVREAAVNQPYSAYPWSDLEEFIRNYTPLQPSGSKYSYSHINYVLLEKIVETITEKPFYEVLQTKVLNPLGLNNTVMTLLTNENVAQGYDNAGDAVDIWEVQTFEAAVGLKSNAVDLMRLLEAEMNKENTLATTFEDMRKVQVHTSNKHIKSGLGWHIARSKGKYYSIVGHTGATSGHQVYMGFIPETKTGVFVLANSAQNLNEIGFFILKMLNYNWRKKAVE